MPRSDQVSATLPKWLMDLVQEYYEAHKEELNRNGIKSRTGLVKHWVEKELKKEGIMTL